MVLNADLALSPLFIPFGSDSPSSPYCCASADALGKSVCGIDGSDTEVIDCVVHSKI